MNLPGQRARRAVGRGLAHLARHVDPLEGSLAALACGWGAVLLLPVPILASQAAFHALAQLPQAGWGLAVLACGAGSLATQSPRLARWRPVPLGLLAGFWAVVALGIASVTLLNTGPLVYGWLAAVCSGVWVRARNRPPGGPPWTR